MFPITLLCFLLKAEHENSNLGIGTILITFDLLLRRLVLFWKLCLLVSAERGEVWLSLQSVPDHNDIQVLVDHVTTFRSCCRMKKRKGLNDGRFKGSNDGI